MSSSEEIEERRRKAMEILKSRRTNNNISPPEKTTSSFYGDSKPQPLKISHANKTIKSPARILSPYEKKNIAPIFKKQVTTCSSSLISINRFQITTSSFNAQLIDMFKTIKSRSYDPKTKHWNFSLQDYDLIQTKIKDIPDAVIGQIPKYILKICNTPTQVLNISCLQSINSKLLNSLMPFQKEGVCFGIEKNGRCLIGDEMGLGKTYQALAIADFYRDDFPMLICTTASTRDVWASKIMTLLPYISCQQIVTMTSNQDYFGEAKVLIVSYALLEKNENKLIQKNFGILILDESHNIKNSKAKCTQVCSSLAKKAKRIILLSGTPALSRPLELYSQLSLIDKTFLNFMEYTKRYCDGKQSTFGWDATGQSNLTELNFILNKYYMIRRTKKDVLSELKERLRETVILDPSLICLNKETEKTLDQYSNNILHLKGREREDMILQFYAQTARIKAKAVSSYVKGLIKDGIKFIIFAHHLVMLDAISNCLDKLNVDYIRIDGSTPNSTRTCFVNRFQTSDSCRAAVLSLRACNSGITLTATQMVVFAELDWNPSTLEQAESRAHRIGQEGIVTVRYLLAAKTVDDIMWQKIQEKQLTLNRAGLSNEDFSDAIQKAGPSTEKINNIEQYLVVKENIKLNENEKKTLKLNNTEENKEFELAEFLSTLEYDGDFQNVNKQEAVNEINKNASTSTKRTEEKKKEIDYKALLLDDDDDLLNLVF